MGLDVWGTHFSRAKAWAMGSYVPHPFLETVRGTVEPFQTALEIGAGLVVRGRIGTRSR